jgi:hypothetical protein
VRSARHGVGPGPCAAVSLLSVMLCAPAFAQAPAGRVEVSGGFRGVAPIRFDAVPATQTTLGGGALTVFETRSELKASPGAVVRIGFRTSSAWWIESSFAVSTPRLVTRVTQDRDVAPATIREAISQYAIEGRVVRRLVGGGRRLTPFFGGGGGYIRNLHDERTLAESGWSAHGGAGFDYVLSTSASRAPRTGLRVDLRGLLLPRDVTLDRQSHVVPVLEATVFVRF